MQKNENSVKTGPERVFDLNLFSRYRDVLFGLAIITIIIWHFSENYMNAFLSGIIHESGLKYDLIYFYYRLIGSIGVEVFIFLSGMGLWYSFSHNSDLKTFYAKRLKRIAAPYLIIAVLYWGIRDIYFSHSVSGFFRDITFVSFFRTGERSLWFIAFIAFMYIVFPLLYKILFSGNNTGVRLIILTAVCVAFTAGLYIAAPHTYRNIEIAVTRIPIFITGIAAAPLIKRSVKIKNRAAYLFIVIAIVIDLAATFCAPHKITMFFRYADSLLSIALMMLFIMLWKVLGRIHILDSALRLAGKYSLEIYLVHVTMRGLMPFFGIPQYRISTFFTMIFLAMMMSPGLRNFSDALTSLFTVKREKSA